MYRQARIWIALSVLVLGVFLILPFSSQYGIENSDFTGIASAGEAKAFDHQFVDIDNHPWGAEIMQEMVRLGILQGYPRQLADTYGSPVTRYFAEPEKAISRAEFAALLSRSLSLPEKKSSVSFADWSRVPGWAQGAVAALYDRDIVEGMRGADGRMYFRPGQEITRAEIAVMVMRALGDSVKDQSDDETTGGGKPGNNPFKDVHEQDWFCSGVLEAYQRGIVNGRTSSSFAPGMNAKRVEVMAVLLRMLEKDETSSSDEELEKIVDDYYDKVESLLKNGSGGGLQDILTGAARLSYKSGGLGILESVPLPGDNSVRIVKKDGGPEVSLKNGRLALVKCSTVVYLESDKESIPALRTTVEEEFGLFQTGSEWKIYSVEIKSSRTSEILE